MDALALFGAGAAGCALALVAVGLVIRDRSLNRRLERIEGVLDAVKDNTKAIEPTKAALDDEGDFQQALMSTRLLMGYINRKSPGALRLLVEEYAPHLANQGKRVN